MLKNSVLTTFCVALPHYLYATDDLSTGIYRKPQPIALKKAYIQPHHRYYQSCLVFDVDHEAAIVDLQYSMHGVPLPSIVIENPNNGHAHFIYLLKQKIYKTDASRQKPIEYGAAIERALCRLLDADVNYCGLMSKNPFNAKWRTTTLHKEPYTLGELASFLELGAKELKAPPLHEAAGLGRNCFLFHDVRVWAYVEIRQFRGKTYAVWLAHVIEHCMNKNALFPQPMTFGEVKGIAKSIARFCWKNDSYCYQEFIDRQTRKAKLGAQAAKQVQAQAKGGKARSQKYEEQRQQAIELRRQGLNNTQIAKQLGVSRMSLSRWFKV